MQCRALASFVLLIVVSLADVALADRAVPSASAPVWAAPRLEIAPEGGMPARRRMPPRPPAPLTNAEVRRTLDLARGDISACLPDAMTHRVTVRATFTARGGLAVRVTLAPRNTAVSLCVDTAARRWLVPLETRVVRGSVSATVQLGATRRPPITPPITPPVTPGSNRYDDGHVRAALAARRDAMLRCLPVSTATVGSLTLRVTARPDGTVVMEGATLPEGVGAGPVLVCLADVVSAVRVPSPPGPRSLTHVVSLGR